MQQSTEERSSELDKLTGMPEYAQVQERSNLQRWLSKWNPAKKSVGLAAIRSSSGDPLTCGVDAARELCRHWAPVFDAKPIDIEAANKLINESATPIPQVRWQLTFDEFNERNWIRPKLQQGLSVLL